MSVIEKSPAKAAKNRKQIINAANKLFYRAGYEHTSFTDIAQESGVPRGNFYYYFKTKDEILDAVIQSRIDNFRNLLSGWDREFVTPLDRLRRSLQMLTNSESEVIRYGCPMGTLNTELGKGKNPHKRGARAMFDLFREWLEWQFRQLGSADPERQAIHLLAMTQGITVMAHVYSDKELIHRETALLEDWLQQVAAGRV